MRILHVIPSIDPATGGPAEGLRQLCEIYHEAGHIVDVVSLDDPRMVGQFKFPADVFALGPGYGKFGFAPRALEWFTKNLAGYDVVFINCIWQFNTLAAYHGLKRNPEIPYAVFAHGMLDPYFRQRFPLKHIKKLIYWFLFLRGILASANAVLFTCEEEKLLARSSFPAYKVREMVVPYGTFGPQEDLEIAREQFLNEWPDLRGKRIAVTLGRIHPKKGLDILIEAFAASLAADPDWRLVIAGPDQIGIQKSLQSLAERLGVADRIAWTGILRGAPKWGAFAAAEIFAIPSHQENFGIVVAEALACSLPVVLSNKVNIWREVESAKAGIVCEDSVASTAEALRKWAAVDGAEAPLWRQRARACFDRNFNYSTTAQRALEIIELIATENGHG